MEVTQEVEIEVGSERVWSILRGQFGEISTWAGRMLESQSDDELGQLGGRQVTTVEYGPATETLYALDNDTHMLGYWVTGPTLPPPISNVQTEWRVKGQDGDGCTVGIRFLAVVNDPESQPMLEQMLGDGMTPMLQELKHYAETGKPHENKVAATNAQ